MNATFPLPEPRLSEETLAQPNLRLRIGAHIVDVGALRVITRPEYPRLTSKAVAVLLELVRHAGDTVPRDAVLDRVWKDRVTTQDVLTQAIKELRRALGDDTRPARYIETIPKVGYRLVAAIEPMPAIDAPSGVPLEFQAAAFEADAAVTPPTRLRTVHWAWFATAALACALALILGVRAARLAPASNKPHWRAADMRLITSDPGAERRPHLSPDGTRVAYSKLVPDRTARVYTRAVEPSQVTPLSSGADGIETAPVWSPDGSEIAFERLSRDSCRIVVASSAGGAERDVGVCHDYATNYFDWMPDGKSLIVAERLGDRGSDLTLERLDLASGVKQPLSYARAPSDQDLDAHYSPDGRLIAFRRGLNPNSDLYVMPADGGPVRQLTHLSMRIRGYTWTADGSALLFSSNMGGEFSLYTVALGSGRIEPLGVMPAEHPHAALRDDTVVYEIPRIRTELSELTLGGSAKPRPLAPSTGSDGAPAFAPDGGAVAFISDRDGSPQVWLHDETDGETSPLTRFPGSALLHPNWSADGKRLLVTVKRQGEGELVEIDVASRRQRIVNAADEHVLSGVYGDRPGTVLMLVGASNPQDKLVRIDEAGSAHERRSVIAEAVAHVEVDAQNGNVYYTKTGERGLFRRALAGGPEEFVTPLVTSLNFDGWRIVHGRVWYLRDIEFRPIDIHEFDPATGSDRSLGVYPMDLADLNFSVSPDGSRVVLVPVAARDTDVGAFRLIPSR
ncbi:MAG TPA: winged helix-turn-helix domain-containing protein [Rudaea sp.]|nr:winged helix-turn-helix domain-containing protein [Rudaea sp.]